MPISLSLSRVRWIDVGADASAASTDGSGAEYDGSLTDAAGENPVDLSIRFTC